MSHNPSVNRASRGYALGVTISTAAVIGQLARARADGNEFVWADGELFVPLTDDKVVDTTGGGDAFVAALTTSLLRGDPHPEAARFATAASGATVGHAGGRPDLTGLARHA
jgi:ribokinase